MRIKYSNNSCTVLAQSQHREGIKEMGQLEANRKQMASVRVQVQA